MTSSAQSVPLVDLRLQHRRIAQPVSEAVQRVMDQTAFILGPDVEKFERQFATYCGTSHCVGVGNGTDALELALRGGGIGEGDQVVIPANTFVATAEAVQRCGAEPVLADCNDDYLLGPEELDRVMTARVRAVVPVHLYGQLAPMVR